MGLLSEFLVVSFIDIMSFCTFGLTISLNKEEGKLRIQLRFTPDQRTGGKVIIYSVTMYDIPFERFRSGHFTVNLTN